MDEKGGFTETQWQWCKTLGWVTFTISFVLFGGPGKWYDWDAFETWAMLTTGAWFAAVVVIFSVAEALSTLRQRHRSGTEPDPRRVP